MENENIESVETKTEDVITESPAESETVEEEITEPVEESEGTLETQNETNESSEINMADTPESETSEETTVESQVITVYEEPIHEVYCTVECNCQDTTPLWESDISQYNITNGLLLMILVALCFNIIMRK